MAEISSLTAATEAQVKANTTYFVIAADTGDVDTLSDDPLKVATAVLQAAIVDEERIFDIVKNILLGGTNVTITDNDTNNRITIVAAGGATFAPSKTNIYDAVKAILQQGTNTTITADDANNELDFESTQFAPTKANIYAAVKAILQASTNVTITADDTDNELDIAASGGGQAFTPSKTNLYAAVKAILQQGTNLTITADDTNSELDFESTQFAPTKSNLYAAVKAILQQGTNITITADDTDNELDFAITQFSPTQANIYTAVKEILQASTNVTITADDTDHELDIASTASGAGSVWNSGALTDNTVRTVSDTEAIQASSLSETGVISTEDITNFGRVYKTGDLTFLSFVYTFGATQGVAFQIRYSDTKPTATSDAKTYGTQCSQESGGTQGNCVEYDVPANRYFWFALSGGGSRSVNRRDLQVRAISSAGSFTPSKANLYAAVKAILQQGTNITITPDDTNTELDFAITQFAPTKANIYAAVKAILQQGTNTTITPDDTNSELDFESTQFSPTQANIYAAVKEILQASTNVTITADDTDHELDIAASGGGGGSVEYDVATAIKTEEYVPFFGSSEITADKVTLTSNRSYTALARVSDTDFWVISNHFLGSNVLEHWVNGSKVSADSITLGSYTTHYRGLARVSNTNFWLLNTTNKRIEHWVNGAEVSADRISLNNKDYTGLVRISDTNFWLLNNTDKRIEHWVNGAEVTGDRMSLKSGIPYYALARVSDTDFWVSATVGVPGVEHWVNGSEVPQDKIFETNIFGIVHISNNEFWLLNTSGDDSIQHITTGARLIPNSAILPDTGTITRSMLDISNAPADGQVLSWDATSKRFKWVNNS